MGVEAPVTLTGLRVPARSRPGKITSEALLEFLETRRWNGSAFVRVRELRPSVGYQHADRRIDLWVLECAPSKGMPAHAVEVKVSRADWLRELRQPLKRRGAMAISNYFWIAAPPEVVDPSELPPGAGLLVVDLDRAARESWYRGAEVLPADYRDKVRCTWGLMASVLRKGAG